MVTLRINNKKVTAKKGTTILKAALDNNIIIPTLCHNDALSPYEACRLCVVEIQDGKKISVQASCNYLVREGLRVQTETERIKNARRVVIGLLLNKKGERSETMQKLVEEYEVEEPTTLQMAEKDNCIRCGLCVRACEEIVGRSAIAFAGRGYERKVTTPFDMASEDCIGCGSCEWICPTGFVIRKDILDPEPVRKMKTWKSDLPLRKCKECRNPFFPAAALDSLRDENPFASPEFLDVCPSCRTPPRVDEDLCTACNACIIVCPVGAAQFREQNDDQKSYIYKENCCGCHTCVDVCGWGAIEV